MEVLNLQQVLDVFNSGEVFSVRYVSLDKKRKTGGKIIEMKSVICPKRKPNAPKSTKVSTSNGTKNHFDNATRTVQKVADGHVTSAVKSVHIFLILEVNGKKMVL